jgi:hypothetical protein
MAEVPMPRPTYICLILLTVLIIAGGLRPHPAALAETLTINDKPVWTMETVKALPEWFGPALSDLNNNWIRIREAAKRQGMVLNYYCIAERGSPENERTIVLLTEYKNQSAYEGREKMFASISKQFANTPGGNNLQQHTILYQIVSECVYQDYTDLNNTQFRLLAEK